MGGLSVHPKHAVDFIIDCVMHAERPVTLLAIGPLTNIAVALLKEPRIREKLERIVIMGGKLIIFTSRSGTSYAIRRRRISYFNQACPSPP